MGIGENLTIYLYREKQVQYRDRDRDGDRGINMDVVAGILDFRDLSVLSWPGIKVPKATWPLAHTLVCCPGP